jgi:hypothetical protein
MATPIITEKELRIWAMDKPEMNTLIDGVKFDSEAIEQAQIYTVDYFNMLPPPIGKAFTVEDFPSRALMLMGVWGHLLKGAAIGETMNELNYSAGGVQVEDRSHGHSFAQLGSAYWQEFVEMAKNVKISYNIEQVFGNIPSEYRRRARYI